MLSVSAYPKVITLKGFHFWNKNHNFERLYSAKQPWPDCAIPFRLIDDQAEGNVKWRKKSFSPDLSFKEKLSLFSKPFLGDEGLRANVCK